jgi:hypothetical protein
MKIIALTRFGVFFAQLKAHFPVKTPDSLRVHMPALPAQKNVNRLVAETNPGLGNLLDALLEFGRLAALRLVVIERGGDGSGLQRPNHGGNFSPASWLSGGCRFKPLSQRRSI